MSFKRYCIALIKKSSVTGVAPIVNSKGCCRKLIKSLILIICVTGFLLQTHEFLQHYWKFSTVESIKPLEFLKKPAITICDGNLIRRRYLCEKEKEMCQIPEESNKGNICIFYPAFCIDEEDIYEAIQVPPILRSYPDRFYNMNFTKEGGFEIDKCVLQCEWSSNELQRNETTTLNYNLCGKPRFIRGINSEKFPGACYVLQPSEDGVAEKINPSSVLKLVLRWWPSDLINVAPSKETIDKLQSRFYHVSFHPPGHLNNPFKEGFMIEERKMYKVKVIQTDRIRMPPPYTSKCYDYIEAWKKNGGLGPLNKKECQAQCEVHGQFEALECVPRDTVYPHDKKLCTEYKSFDYLLNSKIQECLTECRDACNDTSYTTQSEIAFELTMEAAKERFGTPSVVTLDVYFDSLHSETSVYRPKYESVELFSYIGGYLGMWLGWSLVAVFDFVEIIFHICKYPFIAKKKQRKKATLVTPFVMDKGKIKTSKKINYKRYCITHIKESLVTGVVPIINSKGCCRKLIKSLILIVGLAGFILQTHEFLQLYWEFSTVESIRSLHSVKKPAISICDDNLIRRRYLCENEKDMCYEWSAKKNVSFCFTYKPLCVDKDDIYLTSPPDDLSSYPDRFFDLNFTKASGFDIDKCILQCEWSSNEPHQRNKSTTFSSNSCGKPKFIRGINSGKLPGACYVLQPSAGVTVEKINGSYVLKLVLRWWASDLINVKSDTMLIAASHSRFYHVSFHSPGHLNNPFREGFRIQERKMYKVKAIQTDRIGMPPPYASKCYDYIEAWKKNGGRGPLNKKECQAQCEIDAQFEEFACVPRDIVYPHDKKLCTTYKPFDFSLNAKIQECMRKCRDACDETMYTTQREIAGELTVKAAKETFGTPSVVTLEVYFDTLNSVESKFKPKYESVELFSYMGMWLGWSLVAVFDFVEILFRLCKYPFIAKKKPKKRKKSVKLM